MSGTEIANFKYYLSQLKSGESMKDFEDVLLDTAWKKMDIQYNRFRDIENRAMIIMTGIITVIGILMVLLTSHTISGIVPTIFFILASLSFLVTILFCISVLKRRAFPVISTILLIDSLKNEKKERQIKGIVVTLANVERAFSEVTNTKEAQLGYAISGLGIGIILVILHILSCFL